MIIKVCGMKYPENISDLNKLPVDFMGVIFYEKSSRYVDGLNLEEIKIKEGKELVGVFVNASEEYIMQMANRYNLDIIQLHGNESPEFCKKLNETIPVIKAFSIAEASDFEQTKDYEGLCGYFLFDTKTPQHGGSGQKFDWQFLNEYKGNMPFLLSGGISVDDAEAIKQIKHLHFKGIDLNSRFEIKPGLKDINLLHQFLKALNNEQDKATIRK